MTKRAAIYCRVSTDAQRDNYSIPTQLAACLIHAKRAGYALTGDRYVSTVNGLDTVPEDSTAALAYVDDYTSRELSRPSLDAALNFMERVGFDVLIIHSLDRLARDPYIRQTLEKEVQRRGAEVEYVLGNYDDSPEGEVRKDLEATFAKWENTKRTERSLRGKRGKAEHGLYVQGRAPFGYLSDPTVPGGLRIEPETAAVVQEIFRLISDGELTVRGVARHLTEQQIPSPQGNSHWAHQSILKILTNEAYAGMAHYNMTTTRGSRVTLRERSEWISIPVNAIVNGLTWETVQQKLADNRKLKRRETKHFYRLSGMVVCADCERAYVSQAIASNPGEPYYRYYVHRQRDGACEHRCISARKLEGRVWAKVSSVILDPERLREGYLAALEQQADTLQRRREHLEVLKRALFKLEQRRDKLTRTYTDPDVKMTKAEYLAQRAEIDEEMTNVTKQIADREAELAGIPQPPDLETFEAFTAAIRQALANKVDPEPEQKRRALEMLHIKVYVSDNKEAEVKGWYSPGFSLSSTPSPSLCPTRSAARGDAPLPLQSHRLDW